MEVSYKRVGWVLFLFCITTAAMSYAFGLEKVASTLGGADPAFILSASALYVLVYLIRCYRLVPLSLVFLEKGLSYRKVFYVQPISYLASNISPSNTGEVVKALLLKKEGVGYSKSVIVIAYERLTDIVVIFLLSFISIVSVLDAARYLAKVFAACVLASLAAIVVLPITAEKMSKSRLFERVRGGKNVREFLKGISRIKTRKMLFLTAQALSLTVWLLEGICIYLLFRSVGLSPNILWILGAICISTAISVISFVPLGLGVYEMSFIGLLASVGVPAHQALVVIFLARFINLIILFSGGLSAITFSTRSGTDRPQAM